MSDVPLVSVVVVGYRRVELLKRTVTSFLSFCEYPRERLELILCDDASPRDEQQAMRTLPFDRFLMATSNEGLGKNTNKGLLAARGDYILQLQDDWECRGPKDFLGRAIEVFCEIPGVELIRYRPTLKPTPVKRCITRSGTRVAILPQFLFAKSGIYSYTDNPHIKTRRFHEQLGLYQENCPMTRMELEFCARVDTQDCLRVAYLDGLDVFEHIGADQSFNPCHKRERLKQQLLQNPISRWPLLLYLKIKHRGKPRRVV